jgi:hypothetical protein
MYCTCEELLARYDELGIEAGVMLPEVSPECVYIPESNEDVLARAARFPGRLIPFCNIDPRAMTNRPDAPLDKLLAHYKALGAKGVGEVTCNLPFTDPLVQNLFHHVEAAGLPLTFHISPEIGGNYGLYDDPGLPQLEECLRQFPNLRFLGHSQAFWAEMTPLGEGAQDRRGYPKGTIRVEGRVQELMRRYPNLLGDLSAGSGHNALARDLDYAARFLDEFQDRLYFGTDICYPDTPTPLVDLLLKLRDSGAISDSVFRKVARENAAALLELTEARSAGNPDRTTGER